MRDREKEKMVHFKKEERKWTITTKGKKNQKHYWIELLSCTKFSTTENFRYLKLDKVGGKQKWRKWISKIMSSNAHSHQIMCIASASKCAWNHCKSMRYLWINNILLPTTICMQSKICVCHAPWPHTQTHKIGSYL